MFVDLGLDLRAGAEIWEREIDINASLGEDEDRFIEGVSHGCFGDDPTNRLRNAQGFRAKENEDGFAAVNCLAYLLLRMHRFFEFHLEKLDRQTTKNLLEPGE